VGATLTVLPFLTGARLVRSRGWSAALLAAATMVAWIAGFAAANIQLMCRLY